MDSTEGRTALCMGMEAGKSVGSSLCARCSTAGGGGWGGAAASVVVVVVSVSVGGAGCGVVFFGDVEWKRGG